MSVKILGGFAKNLTIFTPKVDSTRPTSVLIRRRLFDSRQNLSGFIFIDLFAGSGAVGFEALSRGAEKIFLNEFNRNSFSTIRKNKECFLNKFTIESEKIILSNLDSLQWLKAHLKQLSSDFKDFIIYIDPPYELHQLYFDVISFLKDLEFTGELWIESDRLKGLSEEMLGEKLSVIQKKFKQGDHFVLMGKVV